MAIVARWEWRTFGDQFGPAEARLSALEPERVAVSDELYLLTEDGNESVKVRDRLLDVKRLEHTNADGLEQWRPVLKAPIVLSAADARLVFDALGADVTIAPVRKDRAHFRFEGCLAELTTLGTEAGSIRTLVVEGEDPALVIAAVRSLGLGARRNVSVARGLKALLGIGAHRFAVIDVGTNSVKLHVGERRADGEWHTVADRAEVTRLGEGLDETGQLGAAPIARTVDAVAAMAGEARAAGVEAIAAVGTAGLRIAPNANDFLAAAQERAGVVVEVIAGEEEARLAFVAATSGLGIERGSLVVFDTGGGSSQFSFGQGRRVDERFSLDVGAVRFTERFGLAGAVSAETLAETGEALAGELARVRRDTPPDALVGMGGAVTNLAAVKHGLTTYDPDVVQGTVLDRVEIDRQIELYRTRDAQARRSIPGLQPNRAEVILAGACIVRTVLTLLGSDSLTVSDRALRHGLIADRFKEEP